MKKIIGIALFAAAVITLIAGFNIDTTIATEYGQRVNNLGLMNQKQNVIIAGGAMLIAGALLLALSGASSGSGNSPAKETEEFRKCPSCAESVKAEAKICKHCQQPLPVIPEAQKGACSHCGTEVSVSSEKCKHCGVSFDKQWGKYKVLPKPEAA